MDDLIVGVGSSSQKKSVAAGKQAAQSALAVFGENNTDIAIVFASQRLEYQKLLDGIRSVVGDVQMVGGTTAGEISTHGFGS
ncbi:MAG: hypothetical protein L3J69_16010, partial [Desulfobacula sp.]|nr:hypothetical protein [Desulfobacula sp.]